MGLNLRIHQKDQKERLSPDLIKEKLSKDFIIEELIIDDKTGLTNGFNIKPKEEIAGNSKVDYFDFWWQGFEDKLDPEDVKNNVTRKYYSTRFSYPFVLSEHWAECRQILARMGNALDMLFDLEDEVKNITPEVFAKGSYQPKKQKIQAIAVAVSEKFISRIHRFYFNQITDPTYWNPQPYRLKQKRSSLNIAVCTFMVVGFILGLVISNNVWWLLLLILWSWLLLKNGRFEVFKTTGISLATIFLLLIINDKFIHIRGVPLEGYQNIVTAMLAAFLVIYLVQSGWRYLRLAKVRNKWIDKFAETGVYNRPGEEEALRSLKVKFVTLRGIVLFIILTILFSLKLG